MIGAISLCLTLVAQPATEPRPLDETYEDIGPLNTSLRLVPLDMRQATGFEQVFRGIDPTSSTAQHYRFDNALAARFPYSTYRYTDEGAWAEIPPGALFIIGMTPDALAAGSSVAPAAHSMLFLDTGVGGAVDATLPVRVDLGVRDDAGSTESDAPATGQSLFLDEGYRHQRVRALLRSTLARP